MSLESALHRVGQMEKETRRRRLKEQVEASAESVFGAADLSRATLGELDELRERLVRLRVEDYPEREADALAVAEMVLMLRARDVRPDEPGGRGRWFRPRVTAEEAESESKARAKGHHRVHVAPDVSVELSFAPNASAPSGSTSTKPAKPSAPPPAPIVEQPAAVVASGRVTRRLGAVTVAEQKGARAADSDNPLAWKSQGSRRDRSVSEMEF